MIGHKVVGKGLRGLAKYVLGKPGVQRLPVGTLAGKTPAALSQEVAWLRAARRDLSKPVLHRTLSLAPGESLTVEQWSWVAVNYMKQMGYGSVPWFSAVHEDSGCQHLHICALSIDPTRQDRFGRPARVADSNDFARSARIIQMIERKLGLRSGAMTPGEAARLPWRQPPSRHVQRLARTGEPSEKIVLQARIDAALQLAVDFDDFKAHLELAGIELREHRKTDRLSGLSFGLGGYRAKGSQLGRRYAAASILNELEQRHEQRNTLGVESGATSSDAAIRGCEGNAAGQECDGVAQWDSGLAHDPE
ncbi:relaxase/mobilization nuclease domain-containing protein [Desulfovibrio aminophilus]|uniref:relaxase/mobilization nuclease domain-containing protein n=1 Tax=Desulfovibrio aminophilus TaxID=81425 RepID=UPI003397EAE3